MYIVANLVVTLSRHDEGYRESENICLGGKYEQGSY